MPKAERVRALVSVHDVMPETLPEVGRILAHLKTERAGPVTLLIVPGAGWTAAGIATLHAFQADGHILAGHGWRHRVDHFGGLGHRLHALLISRRAAEHLSLEATGILNLMRRCHGWFAEQGLRTPSLYVPPAWAMGTIERATLASLPFRHHEIFRGVLSPQSERFQPLPLVGYEADTRARAPLLRLWNRINRIRAEQVGWLRIAIHPRDLELRLAPDLIRDLRRFRRHVHYAALDAPDDGGTRDFSD